VPVSRDAHFWKNHEVNLFGGGLSRE